MRLHHLEVQAFGPFAETVAVDFDALSESGLFLLTGATGAGKTSVLDAVCFALYGEVPGDRQAAKRLRSDQAAPGVRPQVTLELSLGGRRFRLVRSPAWERPKKRGSGSTTEQASVRLSERIDGEWRQLSSRLDETGHEVTALVGMNLGQFCQVAMLPQGRFQAFLRARSEERHKLLQQLFRTGRFEDVETWLRDRRLELRRTCREHHERAADLVSRVSEAADAPLPEAWDPHDLADPAESGAVARWSARLRDEAARLAVEQAARATNAAAAEQQAREAHEQARRLAEAQAAHAAALAQRERLAAGAADHAARTARLSAARRAAQVLPLHHADETARRTCAEAEQRAAERLAAVGADDTVDLDASFRAACDDAATARAALPRQQLLTSAGRAAEQAAAETRRLEQQVAALEADSAAWLVHERLSALRARAAHARQVGSAEAALRDARSALVTVVDRLLVLKEDWLRLQEERIHGMAAELAGALAVGHECPVCGSADHPRPAAALPDSPDGDAVREARRLVDDAEAERAVHEEQVRTLETALAVARERAGDVAGLADELAEAEAEAASLPSPACAPEPGARDRLVAALADARAAHEARTAEVEALGREIDALLDASGADDLSTLVRLRERRAEAWQAAIDARAAHDRARDAAQACASDAVAAAVRAGFADVAAAVAAGLDDDEVAALETGLREHDTALAAAEAVLADPALRAAAAVPPPDLPSLADRAEACAAELGEARAAAALAGTRAQRLAGLDGELAAALGAWAPLRADLDLATRMAALCDGTSPDNRLRMRLSGYVLTWRLTQVVAAANERLARMSDQRYSLEHTGRRGAGENRGGLSLLVRDDWSGETRDPATLSGGETFVVSLALALGLADVIAHEVGGAELDTLFVDEGFGSLDADTLDGVMDTLDTLRDGGRVVGVVSHVAEMRDRIPTQLRVTKSRRGSTLALAR